MIQPGTPELLGAALALDLLLGDPRWYPHPVVGIGRLITTLERLLRRLGWHGYGGGLLLCLLTVGTATGGGWVILFCFRQLHPWLETLTALVIAWNCLALRSLHRESDRVAQALQRGNLEQARTLLSYIVGRDTQQLDEQAIWRANIETVAENSSDGVIAPLFWLTIGGPLAALAYKAASTLDSMVGYQNDRYCRLGWASARLDDLLNLVPARITALLMVFATPLCGLSGHNAWRIWRRDHSNHASPNSGHPEAAAAGALGVQLGGPSRYNGIQKDKPLIGDPLTACNAQSYHRMIRLLYVSSALMVLGCITASALWRAYGL